MEINNNGSGNPFHILYANNITEFAGGDYPFVHVGMKVINIPKANTNWVGEFRWGISEDSTLVPGRVAYLGSTGTTETSNSTYWEDAGHSVVNAVDLVWDLSTFTDWTNETITGPLYFSFWNSSAATDDIKYEIHYISISDTF